MPAIQFLTIEKKELENKMATVSAKLSERYLKETDDAQGALLMTLTNAMFCAELTREVFGIDDGQDE